MVRGLCVLTHYTHCLVVIRQFQRGLDQRLLVQEVSAEEARLDHRGVNPERRQFLMHGLGDAFHRKFGRTINSPTHVGLIAADRRDVDDVTTTLATHVWQSGTGDVQYAEDVGGEQPFRFAGTGFFHRTQHTETGIVDHDIDTTETLDPFCDSLMRFCFAGHVQTHRQQVRVIAQAIGDVLRFTSGGNHSVAGTQGVFCDEGAKTTGSSSNEPSTHFNSSCQRPERYCRAFSMS
ncbi:hypothetical protein D3C81_1374400 [compost metagenome]